MRARTLTVLCFVIAAILATPPPTARAAAHTDPIASWKVKTIGLPVRHAAYVPSRDVLLAVVDPTHGSLGNDLIEMDPRTGAILRTVLVGAMPMRVAASDDGSTAYVGFEAGSAVRVDLATFTVGTKFFMPNRLTVEDLAVAPGQPNVLVASLADGSAHEGTFAFENETLLPAHTDGMYDANHIHFADSSTIYGFETAGSSYSRLLKMSLTAEGVTMISTNAGPPGVGVLDGEMAGDLIATRNGKLMDPTNKTVVRTFGTPPYGINGLVEPTASEDRVAWLGTASGNAVLVQYKLSTGELMGSRAFAPIGNATDFIATATGYAVVTSAGAMHLLGTEVTTTPVSIPAAAAPTIGDLEVHLKNLQAADLLWDPTRNLLYATIGLKTTGTYEREVVAIDPVTTNIIKRVPLGAIPTAMAASSDFSTLYVGLTGVASIAKVNLATFALASSIPVGLINDHTVYASELEVRPGTPDTVAAVLRTTASGYAEAVALYKGSARLPNVIVGGDTTPTFVHFASPDLLYGAQTWVTTFEFTRMTASAEGLTTIDVTRDALGTDFQVSSDGTIWSNAGSWHDPTTLQVKGQFARPVGGGLVLDETKDRAYEWSGVALVEHQLSTGRRLSTRDFGNYNSRVGPLVRFGSGFAVLNDEKQIVLLTPPWCDGAGITVDAGVSHTVTGTNGSDIIRGTSGDDVIDGKGGNDLICGGGGKDIIRGGDGNDRIIGTSSGEWMEGGNGNDHIEGRYGADFLFGDAGNDYLDGGAGNDRLSAGTGADVVWGGEGTDIYSAGSDSGPHVVDLNDLADDGSPGEGDNIRSDVEIIVGTPGPDQIYGSERFDWVLGMGGDDTIRGNGGNDQLDGGAGNDTIDGFAGDDNIYGGLGSDTCRGQDGNDFLFGCETAEQ